MRILLRWSHFVFPIARLTSRNFTLYEGVVFSFCYNTKPLNAGDYQGVQEGEATRASLTLTQLNLYAKLGLRTLCIAKRVRCVMTL